MQPVWDLPLKSAGIVVTLASGKPVRIRPARPNDAEALKRGFERLSETSRYNRFFSARPTLGDALAVSLTDINHETHYAWGVFDPAEPSEVGGDSGLGVGAARLIIDEGASSAEAALTVVDAYHGQGIGTFLIELLVATAADVGVTTLRFEILRQNRAMIHLIAGMGATAQPSDGDHTVVEYHLPISESTDTAVPAGALYKLLRMAAKKAGDAD